MICTYVQDEIAAFSVWDEELVILVLRKSWTCELHLLDEDPHLPDIIFVVHVANRGPLLVLLGLLVDADVVVGVSLGHHLVL